jgi:hypothetical protein
MMHIYFDFAKQTLDQVSPVIAAWTKQRHIGLFDFDSCLYAHTEKDLLANHLTWVADNYSSMAVVEMHPYFTTDERYVEKKELIQEQAAKLNLPLTYWTADYRLWNSPAPDQTFFPGWYFQLRNHAKTSNYQTYPFPMHKKYNFSCCNMANLRFEKVFNYIECFRRKRSDWYLTIYDHPNAAISKIDITDVGQLPQEHVDIWNAEIKHTVKEYQFDLQNDENLNSNSTIFEGHTNAYCNLVMEHSMEIEIVSEKSFKPFIAGQIPVYCAAPGAAQFISQLGFDLFYDFINHDTYDAIFNDQRGSWEGILNIINIIGTVHSTIDQLYQRDFVEYFHRPDVIARLEKNKQHFYSNAIDLMTIQHLDALVKRQAA